MRVWPTELRKDGAKKFTEVLSYALSNYFKAHPEIKEDQRAQVQGLAGSKMTAVVAPAPVMDMER